jgi:hypothetical protein
VHDPRNQGRARRVSPHRYNKCEDSSPNRALYRALTVAGLKWVAVGQRTEIAPEWDAFIASVGRPTTQARIKKLLERGLQKPGDVENRLGHYVGELGQ